jgi:amino acid transporter
MELPPIDPSDVKEFVGFLLCCGLALTLSFWVVVWSFDAWRHLWAWIDDNPEPKTNPMVAAIMRAFGYTEVGPRYIWQTGTIFLNKRGVSATLPYIEISIGLFILPTVVYTIICWWDVVLSGIALVAVAFLARYNRRLLKKIDKHAADTSAHVQKDD